MEVTGRPLVIRSTDPHALHAAAKAVKGSHSLLASATPETAGELRKTAEAFGHVLAVTSPDLDGLASATTKLKEEGFNRPGIAFSGPIACGAISDQHRRPQGGVEGEFQPPGLSHSDLHRTKGRLEETVLAVNEISKYGGLCVLPSFDPAQIASLLRFA